MGFNIARTYRLEFEGFLQGAEVHLKAGSIAAIEELENTGSDRQKAAEILFDHLIDWNLENDGVPIPVTLEGVRSLEESILVAITREWYRAARGITAPLDPPSNDGESSPVESIPMEVSTESL